MTSTALAVLAQIHFRGGTPGKQPYDVPKNTLDPRWTACSDHHPACDCREAEHAEEIGEFRAEVRENRRIHDLVSSIALLHQRRDRASGSPYCASCIAAWPCATLVLVAEMNWDTRQALEDQGARR